MAKWTMTTRTHLQQEANDIDCEIDRLVRRLMRLEEHIPKHRVYAARLMLDAARGAVRELMHTKDRERTG